MKKIYLLFVMLAATFGLHAQHVYNDYDANRNEVFSGWPNAVTVVANPDASGMNVSDSVAQWARSTEQWANVYSKLEGTIDLSTDTVFHMKVYSPIACVVLFKLEKQGGGASVEVADTLTSDDVNKWVTLDFAFAKETDAPYDQITFFLDFATTTDNTFYFDDVEGPEYVASHTTGKPLSDADVQDNFENDGSATIQSWKFQDPDLNDLVVVEDPTDATNHVADYNRSGAFQWTNAQTILDHRLDLSSRNVFSVRVYFPSTNDYTGALTPTVAVKLQNSLMGGNAWQTQTEVKDTITAFDQWVTVEFDFSAIADSVNYDQIVVQLGGEGHNEVAQFYFDDFKLEPAGSQGKPLEATDVQDNFENDGSATIQSWKFQDPDMNDLVVVEDPTDATNHVADYNRSGAFQWTNAQTILDHRLDLSNRNVFSVRVYFPSTNDYTGALTPTVAVKLQNSLMGGNAWQTQTEVKDTITAFDQWVTVEFDFSAIADSVNYDQIVVQLGGEGHNEVAQFYFDDF
jgi:hypothetical protein